MAHDFSLCAVFVYVPFFLTRLCPLLLQLLLLCSLLPVAWRMPQALDETTSRQRLLYNPR
jgi:hypothetical protein